MRIHGIPVKLKTKRAESAVREVLSKIKAGFPDDFSRLKELVREILFYDDAGEGDQGICIHDDRIDLECDTGEDSKCIVKINETTEHLIAVVAHELGHACSRFEDLDSRGLICDEWKSELAADRYAYRWGFSAEIIAHRPNRDARHHFYGPGESVVIEGVRFEVTSDFVVIS
ncbi:MAG: hypothetical protein ACKVX7_00645, partial [Planctomycetota bacterium]